MALASWVPSLQVLYTILPRRFIGEWNSKLNRNLKPWSMTQDILTYSEDNSYLALIEIDIDVFVIFVINIEIIIIAIVVEELTQHLLFRLWRRLEVSE